ncbi:MAG TPA: hypothetical protein VNZ26_20555 [Vicinamibacterales bacterium]|nr:hypothetical protein [Vicinamibacterales bacterium]
MTPRRIQQQVHSSGKAVTKSASDRAAGLEAAIRVWLGPRERVMQAALRTLKALKTSR